MFKPAEWMALKAACGCDTAFPLPDLDNLVREYAIKKGQPAERYRIASQIASACANYGASPGTISSGYAAAVAILGVTAQDSLSRLQFEVDLIRDRQQYGVDVKPIVKQHRPEVLDHQHVKWGVYFGNQYKPLRQEWKQFLLDPAVTPEDKLAGFYRWLDQNQKRPTDDFFEIHTPYFTEEARQRRLVRFEHGVIKRIKKATGQWTAYSSADNGANVSIFVVLAGGDFFTGKDHLSPAKHPDASMRHHSALAGGRPVEGAGEWWVADGKLTKISQRSGHYCPSWKQMLKTLERLEEKGVNCRGVKIKALTYRNDPQGETPDQAAGNFGTIDFPGDAHDYLATRAEHALRDPAAGPHIAAQGAPAVHQSNTQPAQSHYGLAPKLARPN